MFLADPQNAESTLGRFCLVFLGFLMSFTEKRRRQAAEPDVDGCVKKFVLSFLTQPLIVLCSGASKHEISRKSTSQLLIRRLRTPLTVPMCPASFSACLQRLCSHSIFRILNPKDRGSRLLQALLQGRRLPTG